MASVQAHGITIEYDRIGDPADQAMLLIMGFTAQLIQWEDEFCQMLASHGYQVIRFDNRDAGLSSKIEDGSSYTLADMADDGFGLLDVLGIQQAHVIGIAMGGTIAQLMAIRQPERVLSLCSLLSSPSLAIGVPTGDAKAALLAPRSRVREDYIDHIGRMRRVLGSPKYFQEEEARAMAARVFDRSFYPQGAQRQWAAIEAVGDLSDALHSLTSPTVVIHGALDPLVTLAGGEATARAIPDAELIVFPDMAHDLPWPLWPEIIEAIVRNAARAGRKQ